MFGPKRTLKSLMQELEAGLRNGTIILDAPVPLTWLPMASFAQGNYQSYVGDPVATEPNRRQKRATRAADGYAGIMVVSGDTRQQMLRHALVQ